MSIKTQLNDSMKDAMKSGDEVRKRTVRMVLAAVKQAEVDKRVELDDAAVLGVIQKEVKNRRESLEEAKKADRADLIEANEAEIRVLEVPMCALRCGASNGCLRAGPTGSFGAARSGQRMSPQGRERQSLHRLADVSGTSATWAVCNVGSASMTGHQAGDIVGVWIVAI